jgi:starch phosphorylase
MRSTIALNGSYFNTQRMLEQYVQNSYFPERLVGSPALVLEPTLAR